MSGNLTEFQEDIFAKLMNSTQIPTFYYNDWLNSLFLTWQILIVVVFVHVFEKI